MSSLFSPFGTDNVDYFTREKDLTPQTYKRTKFGLKIPVIKQEPEKIIPRASISSPETPNFEEEEEKYTPQKTYHSPQMSELSIGPLYKPTYGNYSDFSHSSMNNNRMYSPKYTREELSSKISQLSSSVNSYQPTVEEVKRRFIESDTNQIPQLQSKINTLMHDLSDIQHIQINELVRPPKERIRKLDREIDGYINSMDYFISPLSDDVTKMKTKARQFVKEFEDFHSINLSSLDNVKKQHEKTKNQMKSTLEKLEKLNNKFDPLVQKVGDASAFFTKMDSFATNTVQTMNAEVDVAITAASVDLAKAIHELSSARETDARKLSANVNGMNIGSAELLEELKKYMQNTVSMFNGEMEAVQKTISIGIDTTMHEAEKSVESIDKQLGLLYKATQEDFNDIQNEATKTIASIKEAQEAATNIFAKGMEEEMKESQSNIVEIKSKMELFQKDSIAKVEEERKAVEEWSATTKEDLHNLMQETVDFFDEIMPILRENDRKLDETERRIQEVEHVYHTTQKQALSTIMQLQNGFNSANDEYNSLKSIISVTMEDYIQRVNRLVHRVVDEDNVLQPKIHEFIEQFETYADAMFTSIESQLGMLTAGASLHIEGVDTGFRIRGSYPIPERPIPKFERYIRMNAPGEIEMKSKALETKSPEEEEEEEMSEEEQFNEEENIEEESTQCDSAKPKSAEAKEEKSDYSYYSDYYSEEEEKPTNNEDNKPKEEEVKTNETGKSEEEDAQSNEETKTEEEEKEESEEEAKENVLTRGNTAESFTQSNSFFSAQSDGTQDALSEPTNEIPQTPL